MSTFLYRLAESLPVKLSEMRAIVSRAQSASETEEELYDILCRAGAVLIATSLEGIIKDINVAIQSDLNEHVASFAAMPVGMQRTFASRILFFEGVSPGDLEKRVNQLVRFFKTNSVNIDMEMFTYKDRDHKNPTANIVDRAFNRYGINSVLHCLSGSKFEAVFSGDKSENIRLRRDIKRMRSTLYKFPYATLPPRYETADWIPVKGQLVPNSIWNEYLGNILRRRHGVVHADSMVNPTSWEVLRSDTEKLEILFSGIIYSVSSLLSKDIGEDLLS